jgi:GT2 family glycosyltransferase
MTVPDPRTSASPVAAATVPRVDVITLTWNQKHDTLECLASLSQLTYPNYRIIVVDNGSVDGTADAVRAQFLTVTLIVNERNLGFQGGFNVGMRHALESGADYIFVMNNDTIVQADILDELMAYAGAPGAGMLGPKIYYFDDPERIWSVGGDCHPVTFEMTHKGDNQVDRGQWSEVIERDFLVGCAMLMPRALPERIGLFDTGYHPIYYEDVDLCMRARRAGFRLLLVPGAKMWHRVSASGGGAGSPRERYLMARHSVRYFRKYVHGWKWAVVVPYRLGSAIKTTLRLTRQRRFASVTAYWRGLRDGWTMPLEETVVDRP